MKNVLSNSKKPRVIIREATKINREQFISFLGALPIYIHKNIVLDSSIKFDIGDVIINQFGQPFASDGIWIYPLIYTGNGFGFIYREDCFILVDENTDVKFRLLDVRDDNAIRDPWIHSSEGDFEIKRGMYGYYCYNPKTNKNLSMRNWDQLGEYEIMEKSDLPQENLEYGSGDILEEIRANGLLSDNISLDWEDFTIINKKKVKTSKKKK